MGKKKVERRRLHLHTNVLKGVRMFMHGHKNRAWFRLIILWTVAYMVQLAFFGRTFLRNYAYIEIFPSELIIPLLIHATTSLIVAFMVLRTKRVDNFTTKLIMATTLSLLLVGFNDKSASLSGLIRAFTPGMSTGDPEFFVKIIYLALLFVMSLLLAKYIYGLKNRLSRVSDKDMQIGVMVLVGFLFIFPVASSLKVLSEIIPQQKVKPIEFQKPSGAKGPVEKPDIYYIVLDRYTNANVLKEQFGYDNSEFTDFLRHEGFMVNDDAYSNYPYTTMSVASTLNAQYTKKYIESYKNRSIQSRTPYHKLIQQSVVAEALKKEGYRYFVIGSWYGASNKAPLADRQYIGTPVMSLFGRGKAMRGVESTELSQSPLSVSMGVPIDRWPLTLTIQSNADLVKSQLTNLRYEVTKEKPGGRFIFAHILVPHDPFTFNRDGSISLSEATDSTGKPIKQKYTDQIGFINAQITPIIQDIQKQSKGRATIILQSDEGPYPEVMNSTPLKPISPTSASPDMTEWPKKWLEMKFGVLQAAFVPNASQADMESFSSVNAFRIVLNNYAGYSLPYLPNCNFALSGGGAKQFRYKNATQEVTGKSNRDCEQFATVNAL